MASPLSPFAGKLIGAVGIKNLRDRIPVAGVPAGLQAVRRLAPFDPHLEGRQGVEIVQPDGSAQGRLESLCRRAVVHARDHEEAHKPLDPSHPAHGSGHRVVVVLGIDLRHDGVCPAVVHEEFATRFSVGAELSGIDLTGALLKATDLTGADLTATRLIDADLAGANLKMATLTKADFSRANLDGVNLVGATIEGARFDDAYLTGAIWVNGQRCQPGSIGRCVQKRLGCRHWKAPLYRLAWALGRVLPG